MIHIYPLGWSFPRYLRFSSCNRSQFAGSVRMHNLLLRSSEDKNFGAPLEISFRVHMRSAKYIILL